MLGDVQILSQGLRTLHIRYNLTPCKYFPGAALSFVSGTKLENYVKIIPAANGHCVNNNIVLLEQINADVLML